ncbi:hypothetical protein HPP92_002103 [Vanilla planifolia]|uniref:Homeobox-leucine zipper protein n=1 Tax=Vanilla planifolia TaxID=51239 RepID=A0A835VMG5_VANPL|nr:hypothetical protein HPP92_002103 [Vanilla planifolia]
MNESQMTYNGLPSSSASPPPFFPQSFLFPSIIDESHQLSPILVSAPIVVGGAPPIAVKRSVWSEDMTGGGGGEEEELSDDCSLQGEKKRRLNMEQVRTLERNFELGNKLEPERKMQLARALGLQPRQIAIWFQNRRARWKTKQLEKDYESLRREFEALKSQNDALRAQNGRLQAEGWNRAIKSQQRNRGSCSNRSENSSDINLGISRTLAFDAPLSPNVTQIPKVDNGTGTAAAGGDNFCNIMAAGERIRGPQVSERRTSCSEREAAGRVVGVERQGWNRAIKSQQRNRGSCSNRSENSSDINLGISRTLAFDAPLSPNVTQIPKVDNGTGTAAAGGDNFCNIMAAGVEPSAFWSWEEH